VGLMENCYLCQRPVDGRLLTENFLLVWYEYGQAGQTYRRAERIHWECMAEAKRRLEEPEVARVEA
jgi:hypothetical protein